MTELTSAELIVAIVDWLRRNKAEVTNVGVAKCCDLLALDTGISVGVGRMKSAALAAGLYDAITKTKGGVPKLNDSFTRDAILAKAIRSLYTQLGADNPFYDDLSAIIARTTPANDS